MDAMSLARINQLVAKFDCSSEKQFQREKSPSSKFMEKTSNFVDRIDKKMKQIQAGVGNSRPEYKRMHKIYFVLGVNESVFLHMVRKLIFNSRL